MNLNEIDMNTVQKNSTLVEQLNKALKAGKVNFIYAKKNGELRTAYGTKNFDIIPAEHKPKGVEGYEAAPGVTKYFDLNSEGWRSFRDENLVSIDN